MEKARTMALAAGRMQFEGGMMRLGRLPTSEPPTMGMRSTCAAVKFGGSAPSLGRTLTPAAASCWNDFVEMLRKRTWLGRCLRKRGPVTVKLGVASG